MCMIYCENKILVQDRVKNWKGITFPGGHVNLEESFIKSTIREVKEETGLDVFDLKLCGVKQFTMEDKSFRYIVFCYKTDKFVGEIKSSAEGEVFWIDKHELNNYNLASGFKEMFEVFENDEISESYHWFDKEWKVENL